MSWIETGTEKQWPPADKITLRLKKLLQDYNKKHDFSKVDKSQLNTSGLSAAQKIEVILQLQTRLIQGDASIQRLMEDVS
jgi:hypothetical protein